ncbi:TetR/AcrR family transcriptional regulator [Desmospora activa]|uniref:TetR family transcriptional regulator n=1 Tax=Desmospora activa DSM 45169 TaxID=1121389 RepID=A0A2T4Z7G8_9BACL|nr:TetR/AcrR family transcriptional regulator [Desmospora activa]PTM57837.1 TetR family transcriptional regulator [Desmospora activa DSM 45169]
MKTFESLEEEKRQRILNAALQEFAEKGFDEASTNTIVKQANIGKGMLFYYFKNKQTLYDYLVDYAITTVDEQYVQKIDMDNRDFIDRLQDTAKKKLACYNEYPHLFTFLGNVSLNEMTLLKKDLHDRMLSLQQLAQSKMYDNIDLTRFRADVDVEKALQLMKWAIEGYQQQLMQTFQAQSITKIDFSPYWDEFDEYLAVLKTSFYA